MPCHAALRCPAPNTRRHRHGFSSALRHSRAASTACHLPQPGWPLAPRYSVSPTWTTASRHTPAPTSASFDAYRPPQPLLARPASVALRALVGRLAGVPASSPRQRMSEQGPPPTGVYSHSSPPAPATRCPPACSCLFAVGRPRRCHSAPHATSPTKPSRPTKTVPTTLRSHGPIFFYKRESPVSFI
jgi:hypothetical protein